jgi:hypothetical protein
MFEKSERPHLPMVIAPGWYREKSLCDTQNWWRRSDGLVVINEIEYHDGQTWLHVSLSRKDRLPTYQDQIDVKEQFVGLEAKAIQVFPPRSQHSNFHPFCLHLYSRLDGDALPDFRRNGGWI